jgi:hypothetical protein
MAHKHTLLFNFPWINGFVTIQCAHALDTSKTVTEPGSIIKGSDPVRVLVLASAVHILKLERYRED